MKFDFIGEYHNELDAFEGDVIEVIERCEEPDWWRARVKGKQRIGFLPRTYLY